MMLLTGRRLVSLVSIREDGWARVPDLTTPTETNRIVAVLSDGREIERFAEIVYKPGEREKLIDAIVNGKGGPRELHLARSILDRRAAARQKVYGGLQREFSRGVWT
jgi:hypothetical protein